MTINILDENQFESYDESYDTPFILNEHAGKKIEDKNGLIQQFKILSLHGVNTPYIRESHLFRKLSFQNVYYIPVFQQKVLAYYKLTNRRSTQWSNKTLFQNQDKPTIARVNKFVNKREEKKLKQQAIRAVYALNLDFALVKVGVSAGQKPWILNVNPDPESTKEIVSLFENAIINFTDKWESESKASQRKVKLGADPEFVLQGPNGNIVLASTYLPKKGPVGCDLIWTNRDRTQLPLAEIRPAPSEDPRQLIINMYNSMLIGTKKIKNIQLKWLAGAMPIKGYPLGGHIHFSNVWLNSFLLRALDNYLTLSVTLLENEKGASRRPEYGFLGDYREQYHGGFEYRTLPSWLLSPTITKGVIALGKLITENYTYLYQNPLSEVSVQEAYYNGDKDVLRPIVKDLWIEIKQLNDFSLYSKYLLPIEELINKEYTWDENTDIRKVWFLPPYHHNVRKKR